MIYTMEISCIDPVETGGAPITGYVASAIGADGTTITDSDVTLPVWLANIAGGVSYDVRMAAVNVHGQGAWSTPVVMLMPNEPGPVTNVTLALEVPIDANILTMTATISFDAGADGFSPITEYQITDLTNVDYFNEPPPATGTPIVIQLTRPGVTTDFQIEIAAVNAVGVSTYVQSNIVTITV